MTATGEKAVELMLERRPQRIATARKFTGALRPKDYKSVAATRSQRAVSAVNDPIHIPAKKFQRLPPVQSMLFLFEPEWSKYWRHS